MSESDVSDVENDGVLLYENKEQPDNIEEEEQAQEPKVINPNSFIPVKEKMIELFGDVIVNNKNEPVKDLDEVYDCTLLCVLFTSSWGSPCRIFNKDLIKIYDEINDGEKILEIIHVSFDREEGEFKNGIAELPWKFLPFNCEKIKSLKEKFGVLTIPKIYPINKNGDILSKHGRDSIYKYGVSIVEKWNEDATVEVEAAINEGERVKNNEGNLENKEAEL